MSGIYDSVGRLRPDRLRSEASAVPESGESEFHGALQDLDHDPSLGNISVKSPALDSSLVFD